jgi:hypothetical protein
LTTTRDLSACKSKQTLIQLLTVNTRKPSREPAHESPSGPRSSALQRPWQARLAPAAASLSACVPCMLSQGTRAPIKRTARAPMCPSCRPRPAYLCHASSPVPRPAPTPPLVAEPLAPPFETRPPQSTPETPAASPPSLARVTRVPIAWTTGDSKPAGAPVRVGSKEEEDPMILQ